ncbi:photosystem II 5 kDa protein, chloroplastic [Beta vulgaris subsp. vulgaris]|uniref:photosystem II 5 kDa protein, chloroplastic n=1 Tax=Beta vulgaris subsp. vulgaris TaxID=3555 RepID=UPI0020366838|nr:photosystem II 5 kDa protein, chloroplastic [Beta vulgaris subsp. vulgaris]
MASITMTPSFLGVTASKQPSTPARRGVVMAKAMRPVSETRADSEEETGSKRRDLMFAAAAAAACSIAKIAMAEEPKRGSPEAKKKYAPVCVTMPSARICYK